MRKVSLMNKAKNKSCVPGSCRAAWEMGVHDLDPACDTVFGISLTSFSVLEYTHSFCLLVY